MDSMDASAFEQLILKFGLVSEHQLAEIHEEIGDGADLSHLIAALERKSYLTPWQRGKVLKGDYDGFFLGGYRILYKIQSGSFGRVFRADSQRDGRVVAVKVLRRRWSDDQQRIDLFIREGKVGLTLKHPNIVEVLAINRDPSTGQYYLVMEFVEGGNLREILQIRKKLTAAESLRIIEDAANGLTYAYSRQMTHRDIKLTNLLISSTGEAKLVDFGLAQFFATLAKNDEEKVDRTVDYAGLERATGVKMGDVRSDIYFLGCVLYEALTGRSPLVMSRDKHARMRKERFEEVLPINPNEIDGPPSVLALVDSMMALDPKQRYQTPAQLLDAVRSVRREVDNKSGSNGGRPKSRSVFIAERDEHLQDILRDGLKDQGYRVFMASDPVRALDRFRQLPYDGLIVDARTTGEDGLRIFSHVVEEAAAKRLSCAAILILAEDQAPWVARVPTVPHSTVMGHDVKFKQLAHKLKELMTEAHGAEVLQPPAAEVRPSAPATRDLDELLHEVDDAPPPPSKPTWQKSAPPMKHIAPAAVAAPVPLHDPRAWRDEIGPPQPEKRKAKAANDGENLWDKISPKQKTGALVLLVVLVVVLLGYMMSSGNISEANYEKIQKGMTEQQVQSILGKGKEVNNPNNKSFKTMNWQDGSIRIGITFKDGKVTTKFMDK